MSVLIVLVNAYPATVSRGDLIKYCWQNRVVSSHAISNAVLKLRKILSKTTGNQMIETRPKIGYRLTSPTEITPDKEAPIWYSPQMSVRCLYKYFIAATLTTLALTTINYPSSKNLEHELKVGETITLGYSIQDASDLHTLKESLVKKGWAIEQRAHKKVDVNNQN
tara:strand:+ start:324 stop:821 length:498 start_codon:yes stop_codon:yes gene_type:complete